MLSLFSRFLPKTAVYGLRLARCRPSEKKRGKRRDNANFMYNVRINLQKYKLVFSRGYIVVPFAQRGRLLPPAFAFAAPNWG